MLFTFDFATIFDVHQFSAWEREATQMDMGEVLFSLLLTWKVVEGFMVGNKV